MCLWGIFGSGMLSIFAQAFLCKCAVHQNVCFFLLFFLFSIWNYPSFSFFFVHFWWSWTVSRLLKVRFAMLLFFFFSSSFCLRAFSTAPGQKKKKTKNKNTLNPPPESGGNSGAIRSRCRTQNVTSSPGEFVHGGSLRVKDRAKKLWSGPTFKRR